MKGNSSKPLEHIRPIISVEQLVELREKTNGLFVHDEIYEYIVNIVEATRFMNCFSMGASPRGTIALLKMSKAMAVIDGRDYVTAQDVQSVVKDVLGHRVKLSARGRAEGMTIDSAMRFLLSQVPSPRC